MTRAVGDPPTFNAVPDVIEAGKMEIEWVLKVPKPRNADGVEDKAYGRSITRAYVTGAAAANEFHTVVALGSENARGLAPTDEDEKFSIVMRIFDEFETLVVKQRETDAPMMYWGPATLAQAGSDLPTTVEFLLQNRDGKCSAWREIFIGACSAQGAGDELLRGDVLANYTQTDPPFNPTWSSGIIVDPDLPAQSNPTPKNDFFDHAVVVLLPNHIFDPSYGKISYVSLNYTNPVVAVSFTFDETILGDNGEVIFGPLAPGGGINVEEDIDDEPETYELWIWLH
jgi:hypothetical protein